MTQLTNLRGIIRGRTIELEEALSVPDGASVTVTVQTNDALEVARKRLADVFGALADQPLEVAEFDDWYRAERHRGYERLELPE